MSIDRKIKEALAGFNGRNDDILFHAEVKSVEGNTCSVEDDGVTYKDVMLTALDGSDSSLTIKPKIGSSVVVADLSEGERRLMVVIQYTEVESISIFGGDKGGLCNVLDLKQQLDIMSNRIDSIIDALKQSATGTQDGGATYKTNISLRLAMLTKEDFTNIEDSRIKH